MKMPTHYLHNTQKFMDPNSPILLMINQYDTSISFALHNCGTSLCHGSKTCQWGHETTIDMQQPNNHDMLVLLVSAFIAALLEMGINHKPKMFTCRVRNSTYIDWL